MTLFVPSPFQAAVFDFMETGAGDLVLNAVAGSGKTKTIEEGAKRLPAYILRDTGMSAFNKHIEQELIARQRAGKIPSEVSIFTIHGFGRKALVEAFRPRNQRTWLDANKYRKLVRLWFEMNFAPHQLADEDVINAQKAAENITRFAMCTLTPRKDRDLDKMAAHYDIDIPNSMVGYVYDCTREVIKWGSKGLPRRMKGYNEGDFHPKTMISFDDMVFLPNELDLSVRTFKMLMVDEAQDLNRAQLELMLKAKGNGRAIFVGDRQQAIYGFAGADAESFSNIQKRTNASELPLSITYRCPKAVVEIAQRYVPQIQAAPDAAEGFVTMVGEDQLRAVIVDQYNDPDTRNEPFLVLCRTNAPLVSMAFSLIKANVPATVKGRDIGKQVVETIDQIAKLNGFKFDEFGVFAETYRNLKVRVLAQRENTEMQVAQTNDMVDCAIAIHEAAVLDERGTLGEMRSYAQDMFTDQDSLITCSSIHKAKGLEAKNVGVIRCEQLPHPMAKQAWQKVQEENLAYIAVTRSLRNLYLADVSVGSKLEVEQGATVPAATDRALIDGLTALLTESATEDMHIHAFHVAELFD